MEKILIIIAATALLIYIVMKVFSFFESRNPDKVSGKYTDRLVLITWTVVCFIIVAAIITCFSI